MNDKMEKLDRRLKEIEDNYKMTNDFVRNKLLRETKKTKTQKIVIICITIVLIFSMLLNAFTIYELSQYEKVTKTVEEYDIEQSTDGDSSINNVKGNQYNDKATHNENKKGDK